MALSGTEILNVTGVQANSQPAATQQQTTTQAIANLASTLTAPNIGAATGTSLNVTGAVTSTTEVLNGATSGAITVAPAAIAGTNTVTLPAVTGTSAMTSGSNLYISDLKRQSALVTSSNTTYANVTGLSFTVVPGTYRVRAYLSGVADGTGGIKYAFHYTTTVVSVLEVTGVGNTAAAVATQHTTTTTDVANLFSQAAAVLKVELDGTIVVTTGGTIDIQVAQAAANASSTTVVGSYAEFTRIA